MREGAVPPPALAGEEVKGISIVDADEGIRVGAKRVARLMNAEGVERDFTAEEPDQWGELTSPTVPTDAESLCLSVVLPVSRA